MRGTKQSLIGLRKAAKDRRATARDEAVSQRPYPESNRFAHQYYDDFRHQAELPVITEVPFTWSGNQRCYWMLTAADYQVPISTGSGKQAQDSCSKAPLWSEKRSNGYGLSEEQAYGHED